MFQSNEMWYVPDVKPDKQADDSLRLQHCRVVLDIAVDKVNIALHLLVQAALIDSVEVVVVDTNSLMDEFEPHSKFREKYSNFEGWEEYVKLREFSLCLFGVCSESLDSNFYS